MSRRDWITVGALGLAVLLAVLGGKWLYDDASRQQTVYENLAEQKAQHYRDSAYVSAKARCSRVARAQIRPCVDEEYDAARKGEHDEYDLQAQLVTSVWTRAMGIAAIIGMAVGILGVGLIFITFRENKRTADVAENALAESGRPHLLLGTITIGSLGDLSLDDEIPVVFNFVNHGTGPAWMREYRLGAWLRNAGEPHNIDANALGKVEVYWTVHPNGGGWKITEDRPSKVTLNDAKKALVLSGVADLFVGLMIKYVEASGKLHEHRLMLKYETSTERLVPTENAFNCYT